MSDLMPDFRGKVRDSYFLDDERLLIVASDRISVFDVVLTGLVPGKGKSLVTLTEYWLREVFPDIPNHLITTDMSGLPEKYFNKYPDLQGRGMIVQRAKVLPVECIVRGYLEGSGLKEYERSGTVTGIPLPPGLVRASQLPEPIFTPSTKAEQGEHDENIDFDTMVQVLGGDRKLAERLRNLSLEVYRRGAAHALARGVIGADTKFEWGILPNGELILCDEVWTGDSSRLWDAAAWEPGKAPKSFDKQPVRDYFDGLGWNKKAPAPHMPDEVRDATTVRYEEGVAILTGPPTA